MEFQMPKNEAGESTTHPTGIPKTGVTGPVVKDVTVRIIQMES